MLDTLVIGARCAGATLAIHLAQAGKRVLAIDINNLPSDQPMCTHWISPYGMALLDELGLGDKVRKFAPPVPSMLFGADDALGRLQYPAGSSPSCVRRTDLDKLLLDAARAAGAEVRLSTKLVALIHEGARVVGAVVETDGIREEIRARIVVGADGPHSTTAKLVGAEEYHGYDAPRAIYWAYWPRPAWFQNDPRYKGGAINCNFGDEIIIVFPTNHDLLLIGIAFPREQLPEWEGQALKKLQEKLQNNQYTKPLITEQSPVSKAIGTKKLRFFFRQAAGPGWALVGDAGLFMDPSPGYGITDAFRDAKMLSLAIIEGEDNALMSYWRQRDATSIDLFEYARSRGAPAHNNPLSRLMYRKLASDSMLHTRLIGVQNRERSPLAIFDPNEVQEWVMQATSRGEAGLMEPLMAMSQRSQEIRAEIAFRQSLHQQVCNARGER